jgi:hypothetical protein
MKIQKTIHSKQYLEFNVNKVKSWLKIDSDIEIESDTLEELYEDSVDFIEKFIQKDVAYTLNEYVFYPFNGSKVTIDEGNLISISAVTYTDYSDVEHVISEDEYELRKNNNLFTLKFNVSFSAKELKIIFYSGYLNNKMDKSIRKALRVLINDSYDVENSSYTLQAVKKNDVIERTLWPIRKNFFNYS